MTSKVALSRTRLAWNVKAVTFTHPRRSATRSRPTTISFCSLTSSPADRRRKSAGFVGSALRTGRTEQKSKRSAQRAQQAGAALIADGQLKNGEVFGYLACAFPETKPARVEPAGKIRFEVEEVAPSLALNEMPLERLLDNAVACGTVDEDDMPVFI